MKIPQSKVKIRQCKMLATTMRAFNGGKPERVIHVEVPIEIFVGPELLAEPSFGVLFPFGKEAINTIAGREENERRGLDMTARGHVSTLNVQIIDTAPVADRDSNIAFDLVDVGVKGRPKLAIDELGNAILHTKLRAWFRTEAVARLGGYVDGEVWIRADAFAPLVDGSNTREGTGGPNPGPGLSVGTQVTGRTSKRSGGKKSADDQPLGRYDEEVSGLVVRVEEVAIFAAESVAKVKGFSFEQVLNAAKGSARLSATPGTKVVVVTAADVEAVGEELSAAAGNAH